MISAIVLAAGQSRRMGAQKLLLPLGDRPVIRWVLDELLASPIDSVTVIVGAHADQIAAALAACPVQTAANPHPVGWVSDPTSSNPHSVGWDSDPTPWAPRGSDPPSSRRSSCPVRIVANPEPTGDMLSSVRCGLLALPANCEAIVIALGDQPGITHNVVAELINAFHAGGRIVVPTCGGRRGHPLLLGIEYRGEILQTYDAVGLRGLLQAHPRDVVELPVASPGILEDIDLPEDYRRIAGHPRFT